MNISKQINPKENAITLISLVITIILLLILSSVVLMSFEEEEIIGTTDESINFYKEDREAVANTVDGMTHSLDEEGMLSSEKLDKIKNRIKSSKDTIIYRPQDVKDGHGNPLQIVVPSAYNGGVADQTFTQANLGAKNASWYLLSADERGLNIVCTPTQKSIAFADSSGYNNCLYYLDQLSKKFFLNESDYGVDESRVHALRLSDIQKAAEWYNGSSYSWISRFENGAPNKGSYYNTAVQSTNKYWPGIFSKYLSNGNLTIIDGPESEKVGDLITDDTGIERQTYANPANRLTATGKYYDYMGYRDQQNNNLCISDTATEGYGRTKIIQNEIFSGSGTGYWLASRCFKGESSQTEFYLRRVNSGTLSYSALCYSSGTASGDTSAKQERFRVVVSIPPEHVEVSPDGLITLK